MERGWSHKEAMNPLAHLYGSASRWRHAYDSKFILSCRKLCSSFSPGGVFHNRLLSHVTLLIEFDGRLGGIFAGSELGEVRGDVSNPPQFWKDNVAKIERLCLRVNKLYHGDTMPSFPYHMFEGKVPKTVIMSGAIKLDVEKLVGESKVHEFDLLNTTGNKNVKPLIQVHKLTVSFYHLGRTEIWWWEGAQEEIERRTIHNLPYILTRHKDDARIHTLEVQYCNVQDDAHISEVFNILVNIISPVKSIRVVILRFSCKWREAEADDDEDGSYEIDVNADVEETLADANRRLSGDISKWTFSKIMPLRGENLSSGIDGIELRR